MVPWAGPRSTDDAEPRRSLFRAHDPSAALDAEFADLEARCERLARLHPAPGAGARSATGGGCGYFTSVAGVLGHVRCFISGFVYTLL